MAATKCRRPAYRKVKHVSTEIKEGETMEDQQLLSGLQEKDEQALAACIRQYGAYAAAVVRAAGPGLSAQDVEEAAAEAFVKLWQAASRLDPAKGMLKNYLAAVCRNEARSRLRALRPMLPLEEDLLTSSEQAAQTLERREMERLTREALDSLDEQTREIFLRYYYNREKTAQIAQDMGLTLSAVKTRLARGREKLRGILQKRGVTCEDVV